MTGLMAGKRGLIMGLANDKSLAWGIAQRLKAEGAELAISYQGEVMEKRVRPLAEQLGCDFLIDCDVSDMANLDAAFAQLAARWPTIDFVVHAIGFTNKEALRGKYFDVTLDDFLMTMNISVYSFTAVAKRAAAMMKPYRSGNRRRRRIDADAQLLWRRKGGAALQCDGRRQGRARRLASNISPTMSGPMASASTQSRRARSRRSPHRASAISATSSNGTNMNSPLRRNVTIDDVGASALYFLSDLSAGVTGETHHVDAGYHTVGMKQEDAPDIALG
jgi:enoyl-[acyl-carrier protein] reductase I